MHDYLACVCEPGSPETLPPRLTDALARRGCITFSSGAGLRLFASPDLPVRTLAGANGWVIGHLFGGAGARAPAMLDVEFSPDGVKRMVKRFWGAYVALFSDSRQAHLIRDPSGGLACYHARIDGRRYLTSMPDLLVDCALIRPQIEWAEVARSLAHHSARLAQTAIRGMDELRPGGMLTIAERETRHNVIWNAWEYALAKPPGEPAEALRSCLCTTLEAWGRSFRRPLVEISGGLDSAIVAAGLSQASGSASLITFAAAPGDPDETLYASAIAEHLGLELAIVEPRIEDVDLTRSLSADLPRPNARAFTQSADGQSLEHARAIGADAFASGGGGDDIFCYLRTVLPAIDRMRVEGIVAMLSSAMDIATMNHSTLWEALYRIARRLIRRRPGTSQVDLRFLSQDARAEESSPGGQTGGPCPGKSEHVSSILSIHNYLEGHARAGFAPILSPLLSQPIVECCLSIPTWHWCEGGRNRAVARRAFSGLLPPIILERRSKGHFDGFCGALFDRNRDLVRSILLDGHLAAQGLLDCKAIEAALRSPFPPADNVSRLLALIDVESWTASWLSRPAYCV
jgi:asparagine synthase (glutamine-hydrolysing)